MIPNEVLNLIASRTNISKKELIEEDLILHRLLLELANIHQFSESYVFKGGTCLLKCYLGYFRFSEDLDFTYINQKEFDKKSEKQIKKIISGKIDSLSKIIEEISNKIGLDFKQDKKNGKYFEFGAGGKFTTMKLWYIEEESRKEGFVKIQINFIDKILYPTKECLANNIFFGIENKFEDAFFLPENYEWLLKIPTLGCYDIKEILIEKVRAILTRKGIKERDFIDIFLIFKQKNLNPKDFKEQITEKTNFMLKKYGKYANNIKNKDFSSLDKFALGEEEKLLIKKIPDGFEHFLKNIKIFLESLKQELK
jgi:predicted nucleotidyltransferase component of viral defense system